MDLWSSFQIWHWKLTLSFFDLFPKKLHQLTTIKVFSSASKFQYILFASVVFQSLGSTLTQFLKRLTILPKFANSSFCSLPQKRKQMGVGYLSLRACFKMVMYMDASLSCIFGYIEYVVSVCGPLHNCNIVHSGRIDKENS